MLLHFFQLLNHFWPPKIEPKSPKIQKQRWKIDVKKTHVFQHVFFSISLGFGFRKRLPNRGFFAICSKASILWKLTKTIEKTMVFVDLSGSEAPKIHPKSMSKRARKKHRKKTSEKSILASILASQNLPKIDPASKNVWLNFMLEIETSGRSGNQRKPAQTSANQRNSNWEFRLAWLK